MSEWQWEYDGYGLGCSTDPWPPQDAELGVRACHSALDAAEWFTYGSKTGQYLDALLTALTAGLRALDAWESEANRVRALLPEGWMLSVKYWRRWEVHAVCTQSGSEHDIVVTCYDRLTALRMMAAALRVLRGEP